MLRQTLRDITSSLAEKQVLETLEEHRAQVQSEAQKFLANTQKYIRQTRPVSVERHSSIWWKILFPPFAYLDPSYASTQYFKSREEGEARLQGTMNRFGVTDAMLSGSEDEKGIVDAWMRNRREEMGINEEDVARQLASMQSSELSAAYGLLSLYKEMGGRYK